MVSKADVLDADWRLLRIEIAEHDASSEFEAFDGYSRFWSKEAVLGAYWIAEKIEETRIRLHLTEDIELEGFRDPLDFVPDTDFKRELLSRCNWEEVVQQIFPAEQERQLSLFENKELENKELEEPEETKDE